MDEPNRKMIELMASSLGVEPDRVETMPSRTWIMDNGTAVTMDVKRYWLDYAKKLGDVIKPWSIDVSVVTYTPQAPSEERWAQYVQDNDPRAWPPIEARSAITEIWLCPPGDGGIYNMWQPSDKPNAAAEFDRLEEQTRQMDEAAKELGFAALGSETDR